MSARSLTGWGVNRLAMVDVRVERVAGESGVDSNENTVSGSLLFITKKKSGQEIRIE